MRSSMLKTVRRRVMHRDLHNHLRSQWLVLKCDAEMLRPEHFKSARLFTCFLGNINISTTNSTASAPDVSSDFLRNQNVYHELIERCYRADAKRTRWSI